MPLRDLRIPLGIVPNPCNADVTNRNWDHLRFLLQLVINNLLTIQEANDLTVGDEGDSITNGAVVEGRPRWAISLNDGTAATWLPSTAANGWMGEVKANPCEDSAGRNEQFASPIWVKLPGREDALHYLPAGSIFAYEKARNGELVIVSDYSELPAKVRWGVAQADSTDGPPPSVTVHECDNAAGDNPVAPDLTVLLPPRDGYDHDVTTGTVVAFVESASGELVCVSDYTAETQLLRFELVDPLVPAGSASAELLAWDGAAYSGTGQFVTVRDTNVPGRWRAAASYRGIAAHYLDRGSYEVVFVEEIAQFAAVELSEDMGATVAGQSGGANVLSYWNGNDPGTTVDVFDKHGIFADYLGGDRLIVAYDWRNGLYHPVHPKASSGSKVRWGKAQGYSVTGAPDTVSVQLCDDALGTNPTGGAITVILPERAGYTHDIAVDDVIAFMQASDDTYVCVSDYTKHDKTFYCRAQAQWSRAGTVSVKLLTGGPSTAETGAAFDAYFTNNLIPNPVTGPPTPRHKCPNVYKGMNILCAYDAANRVVVVDPNAYDEPIGTIRLLMHPGQFRDYYKISDGGSISVGDAASGSYTLAFEGQTTASIAYNANAATIQTELEALSTIGSGNITITGTGPFTWAFGGSMSQYQSPLQFSLGSLLNGVGGAVSGAGASGTNLSGWGAQDGDENSSANGGSGRDWTTNAGSADANSPTQFPPIYPFFSPAATSNAISSAANLAHDHTITTDIGTTGIAIADHGDHIHPFGCSTCQDILNNTGTSYWGVTNWHDQHVSGLLYTGGGVDSCSTHPAGVHTGTTYREHVIADAGHIHTASATGTYGLVHYKTVIALERLDNSTQMLGGRD